MNFTNEYLNREQHWSLLGQIDSTKSNGGRRNIMNNLRALGRTVDINTYLSDGAGSSKVFAQFWKRLNYLLCLCVCLGFVYLWKNVFSYIPLFLIYIFSTFRSSLFFSFVFLPRFIWMFMYLWTPYFLIFPLALIYILFFVSSLSFFSLSYLLSISHSPFKCLCTCEQFCVCVLSFWLSFLFFCAFSPSAFSHPLHFPFS